MRTHLRCWHKGGGVFLVAGHRNGDGPEPESHLEGEDRAIELVPQEHLGDMRGR